ncbi:MAG: hypothetical protein ACM3S4_04720 [Burkholderiales bacterium]
MSIMIFDSQKSYIRELLEKTGTHLADYTNKELDKLTCREADRVMESLKEELRAQRLQQRLGQRFQYMQHHRR